MDTGEEERDAFATHLRRRRWVRKSLESPTASSLPVPAPRGMRRWEQILLLLLVAAAASLGLALYIVLFFVVPPL